MIPAQPLGRDICGRDGCERPIHLVNTQLGEEWVHDDTGFAWCNLRALPSSRPWPEEVTT